MPGFAKDNMHLFGFLGPFPGPHGFDALAEYGASTMGRAAGASAVRPQSFSASWAPCVAGNTEVTVALSGAPLWKDGSGATVQQDADAANAIFQAYLQRGDELLASLRGRFALAILDGRRQRVLLAVDPMGIERLAYATCGSGIVFASSAEACAHFPELGARLRPQALFDYLMMHMVPAPHTVFVGVSKLSPGTCAVFERGTHRIERYWRPHFAERRAASFAQLKAELHRTLRVAVRSSRPDPRTGAFLSGGLDSSTVAGVLSEVAPSPANTFSIGFGYAAYDELPFARIANERFGCAGHEYVVSGADIAASFADIARAYDEPFGNSSALPLYYCARLAAQHGFDHLLAGDGGDEIFAGNSRYAEQQVFEHYRHVPAILRRRLLEPLLQRWPERYAVWPINKARSYVEKARVTLPERLEMWNIARVLGTAELLHPDFLRAVDLQAPYAQMQRVWDSAPTQSALDRMLYYDWHYTLADNDLRKVETMSALAGVRVSYPMLHPDVIDMSLQVPAALKMPGRKLRHFYKEAMTGFLPAQIIHKKKHGFGLPFGLWLQESAQLREVILGNLSSLRGRNIIRPQFVDRLLRLHGSDDASYYGVLVWVLAMLEQWFQEHRIAP